MSDFDEAVENLKDLYAAVEGLKYFDDEADEGFKAFKKAFESLKETLIKSNTKNSTADRRGQTRTKDIFSSSSALSAVKFLINQRFPSNSALMPPP
jgi:hypothetical protein